MTAYANIRLVFTASTGVLGRLIRWLTGSQVSHVMIEYPSAVWSGRWVAEATKGGVRKVPTEKARHNVVVEYQCRFNATFGLQSIREYVGNPYDYRSLLSLGFFYLVWRLFKVKVRHPFTSSSAMMCSELAARMLISLGLPGTVDWDPERITPDMVLQYCDLHEDLFKKVAP